MYTITSGSIIRTVASQEAASRLIGDLLRQGKYEFIITPAIPVPETQPRLIIPLPPPPRWRPALWSWWPGLAKAVRS